MHLVQKGDLSFGASHDRKLFPLDVPPNRNGNECIAIRGDPHLGPGYYDVDQVSHIIQCMDKFSVGLGTYPCTYLHVNSKLFNNMNVSSNSQYCLLKN